ncbi:alcohol dehydrogenase superfamily protein [Tanacetum coccineum]
MKPEDQINFGISRVDIDDSNCMEHGSYRTLTLSRAGTEVFVHTFVIATTSHALRAAYTHSLNAFTPSNYQLFLLRKTSRAFNMSLQHLPLSPGINPGFPILAAQITFKEMDFASSVPPAFMEYVKNMSGLIRFAYDVPFARAVVFGVHIGGMFLEKAIKLGATVTGTVCTKDKALQAKEDGFHHVIMYKESGQGIEVVFHSVGEDTFENGDSIVDQTARRNDGWKPNSYICRNKERIKAHDDTIGETQVAQDQYTIVDEPKENVADVSEAHDNTIGETQVAQDQDKVENDGSGAIAEGVKEEYFMAYDQNKAENDGGTATAAEGPKGNLTDADNENKTNKGEGEGEVAVKNGTRVEVKPWIWNSDGQYFENIKVGRAASCSRPVVRAEEQVAPPTAAEAGPIQIKKP